MDNGDNSISSNENPAPPEMSMQPPPADGSESRYRGPIRSPEEILKWSLKLMAAENVDAKDADAENADAKNMDVENADAENADAENMDTENADTENAEAENADAENADAENAEAGGTVKNKKMKFLSDVLSSLSVDVQQEIKDSINILLDPKKEISDYIDAFNVLDDYVDNLDFANDFQKLGGFQVFESGLKSDCLGVRIKTTELIAAVLQLNTLCQNKFIEQPIYIKLLMKLVEREDEALIRIKAMTAISSCIRNNVDAFWKFIEYGGDKLIIFAMKSFTQRLMIKATFFVISTCQMEEAITDFYFKLGVVELICSTIMTMEGSLEHVHHDLFLESLNKLFKLSPERVINICSKIDGFKTAILNLKASYPLDIDYEDYREQIDALITNLKL